MSLVGNLEDLGLAEILQIVSLSRKTGTLSLRCHDKEGSIVFRQGQVVRATSSSFRQSLGEVLIQRGVIDLAVLRKALAIQQEEGFRERLGVILIKHFGIPYELIEEVVREQIENVAFTLFTWGDGTFEFIASESIETVDNTRLDPLQFMLDQGLNPQYLAMEASRIRDEGGLVFSRENQSDLAPSPEHETVAPDDIFQTAQRRATAKRTAERKPLVIVDDDGPSLQAIAEGMRQQGFDVHALTRSEDALVKVDALYRTGQPPQVLIDLIMPKMDGSGVLGGIELLELLHNNFKDILIIVMSDYRHTEAENTIKGMGYPFVTKPRRGEISDPELLQPFMEGLCAEISRCDKSGEVRDFGLEPFNLGDEMRLEMGEDQAECGPAGTADGDTSGMSLLRSMLEELNNPELQGGVLLLALRFASEFLNRAIVFSVSDKVVSGIGQFGIPGGRVSGDAKVRSIHFPLEADSMFNDPTRLFKASVRELLPTALDLHILEQIGGGIPAEVYIGPIASGSRIVGFLYGDNLPDGKSIGSLEPLSIFLSQAGMAIEKSLLEQKLHERNMS